jgi:DNA polymerase beta
MAKKLIDAGVKTIADLQKEQYSKLLSQAQKLAIQHLHHLDKPLSREQAETVAVIYFCASVSPP